MLRALRIWLFLVCASILPANAAEFTVPKIDGHVTDNVGVLSSSTRRSLEGMLADVKSKSGIEMGILIIPTLEGFSIEEASIKVAETWQLGTAKDDKGLLLLIAVEERKLRFEVGQGLEGDLTDLQAARIIRNTMVPRLRSGQFDEAVAEGTREALELVAPNLQLGSSYPGIKKHKENLNGLAFIFWIFVFLIFPFLGRKRRRRSSGLLGSMYYGPGPTSRGWNSGGFGGGFGGGGGFSGGGASGGW